LKLYHDAIDGMSVCQMKNDSQMWHKKQCLVFVINDDHPKWQGSSGYIDFIF
jgi:hypothetical protein